MKKQDADRKEVDVEPNKEGKEKGLKSGKTNPSLCVSIKCYTPIYLHTSIQTFSCN